MLEERFDRVILDSPPLNAVADPLILSSYADGMVLVARSNQTTMPALKLAQSKALGVNAKILGVILNDVNLDEGGTHHHYYYYKAGYYYSDESLASS